MILGKVQKDPADIRVYEVNWAPWLRTYTLSTSTWSLPAGLTNVGESNTTTSTQVKISGGVGGTTYTVGNTITSSNGETKKVYFNIIVEGS